MNIFDNGTAYTVEFAHWDLWCFSDSLCRMLSIQADEGYFTFDKETGDLIEAGGDALTEAEASEANQQFYAFTDPALKRDGDCRR